MFAYWTHRIKPVFCAGIIPDSLILPRGILAALSTPSAYKSPVPKLTSDALSPSDRFILDEVIRHVQTTHPSPLPEPDLSQPSVWDGTNYKRISPRTCSKSAKPFLRYVDLDFCDTSARTQVRITGVYVTHQMTPHLNLPIVTGSTTNTHTLRLQHVSTTMNTNPVTKFWQIPTTFLLLLFLQLSVAPTKFTPLRHVEFRTKRWLLDKRWHTLRRKV